MAVPMIGDQVRGRSPLRDDRGQGRRLVGKRAAGSAAIFGLALLVGSCRTDSTTAPQVEPEPAAFATGASALHATSSVGSDPLAATQVDGAYHYACAVRGSGLVGCWGNNDFGQAPPTRSAATGSFVQVNGHKQHTCALRTDGVVECWGSNDRGQAPATRTALTGSFTKVEVGQVFTCALRDDGVVECWGGNGYGQSPATRTASKGYYVDIGVGDDHACALRSDGVAECWGQLTTAPKHPASGRFIQITSGDDHTCALRSDGVVECWFLNSRGQAPPTKSAMTGGFVEVRAGGYHTCALRTDGVVECWGGGTSFGEAPGTRTAERGSFTHLGAGYYLSCAARTDGAVECWGRNHDGEGTSEQRILVPSTPPDPAFVGTTYVVTAQGGGSGSPVVISSLTTDVCTVSNSTVTVVAVGTCTVAADQAGAWRYFSAPQVTQSFTVSDGALPAAPTNASATFHSSPLRIEVTWTDASDDEDTFALLRRVQQSGSWGAWESVGSLPANTTSHTDTDVTTGLTYQYQVSACNDVGCSAGQTTSGITAGTKPARPADASATVLSSPLGIELTWTDSSDNEDLFRVRRRIEQSDGSWGSWSMVDNNVPANTTSYVHTDVIAGNTYQYQVRACNALGCSTWRTAPRVTAGEAPAQPQDAMATVLSSPLRIELTWTDASDNEEAFPLRRRIEQSDGSWGEFATVDTVPANTTSYTHADLTAGETYQYQVRACNEVDCSKWKTAPRLDTSGS